MFLPHKMRKKLEARMEYYTECNPGLLFRKAFSPLLWIFFPWRMRHKMYEIKGSRKRLMFWMSAFEYDPVVFYKYHGNPLADWDHIRGIMEGMKYSYITKDSFW